MADPDYVDLPATNRYTFEYSQSLPQKQVTDYASSLRKNADADYDLIRSWFDGLMPAGVPFSVKINPIDPEHPERGGKNQNKVITIYNSLGNFAYGRNILAHETIELFMAAFQRGWVANQSHGEALAQVTGFTVSPTTVSALDGPRVWVSARTSAIAGNPPTVHLSGNSVTTERADYVSTTDPTDEDPISYGCGVLFLYYLQTQLGFSLRAIVQGGASTLEGVYHNLTQASNAWADFSALIETRFPHWNTDGPNHSENPFPLPTPRKLSTKRYLNAHPLGPNETIGSRIRATNIGQLRALLNRDRPAALFA